MDYNSEIPKKHGQRSRQRLRDSLGEDYFREDTKKSQYKRYSSRERRRDNKASLSGLEDIFSEDRDFEELQQRNRRIIEHIEQSPDIEEDSRANLRTISEKDSDKTSLNENEKSQKDRVLISNQKQETKEIEKSQKEKNLEVIEDKNVHARQLSKGSATKEVIVENLSEKKVSPGNEVSDYEPSPYKSSITQEPRNLPELREGFVKPFNEDLDQDNFSDRRRSDSK